MELNPPTEPTPTPPPAPAPEPPPATKIVVTGQKTEREIELETKLTEAEAARKKAETDAAYQADERQRLLEVTKNYEAALKPKAKTKKIGVGWFESEED